MSDKMRFHFLSTDLFAAAIDLVFDASGNRQIAGGVATNKIPGAIEAIDCKCFRVPIIGAVVAANRVGPATPQFARFAGCNLASAPVDYSDFVGRREWPPLR